MSRSLTLNLPDDVDRSLEDEMRSTGRSREEVVVTWLRQHVSGRQRGTFGAILPYYGAWSMTDEEQREIEQMIQTERNIEDEREWHASLTRIMRLRG